MLPLGDVGLVERCSRLTMSGEAPTSSNGDEMPLPGETRSLDRGNVDHLGREQGLPRSRVTAVWSGASCVKLHVTPSRVLTMECRAEIGMLYLTIWTIRHRSCSLLLCQYYSSNALPRGNGVTASIVHFRPLRRPTLDKSTALPHTAGTPRRTDPHGP